MPALSESELLAVDAFLAGPKRLEGAAPAWVKSERPNDVTANWNIIDQLGVVAGHLRFRLSKLAPDYPSVSMIFRQNSIWRVDLCPPELKKLNPPWATEVGLPPFFFGSHCHRWTDNRKHVGETGVWNLDARRPVEKSLRRVRQMLPWFADATGIQLESSQRDFDAPLRSELFEEP
jgi:hypothetical protein